MKIKRIKIDNYKNLQGFEITFSSCRGATLLVGNNGCGKSNILEAISSIFAGLYKDRIHKPVFSYELDYEANGHNISVVLKNRNYQIVVDGMNIPKSNFTKKAKEYLPSNIIACYSGESSRLWGYFYPHYKSYIDSIKTATELPELNLFYINKFNLETALLTLLFHDFIQFTDIANFIDSELGIKEVKSISFEFNIEKIKSWTDNTILFFVRQVAGVEENSKIEPKINLSLEELKKRLEYLEGQERVFFKYLYGTTMPKDDKIITKIEFQLELVNGSIIDVDDFSEGEKKSLLIKFIQETLADENSVILFDEPDSHIHISRKKGLKELADKYQNRENIWTTHSPSLASAFNDKIIGIGLDNNNHVKIIDKNTAELVADITDGIWNVHQLNVFLSSNKPMTLLVEGETDKSIIEHAFKFLRSDYPDLDFDIYHCSGAENIPQLVVGLKTSDINWGNKKIIAVFDSDKEGTDCCNKTQVRYQGKKSKNNFYAITLPKKNSTIENFFPDNYFNEAINETFKSMPFSGSIKDYSHKLIIKAKVRLSNNCKDFEKAAFNDFRLIFEELSNINKL